MVDVGVADGVEQLADVVGEPVKINTGDSAFFPKGWAGTWDIHETLRKVYVIF